MKIKIENKHLYSMGENVVVTAISSFENIDGKMEVKTNKLAVPRIGKVTGVKSVCGNEFWTVRWGIMNKEVLVSPENIRVPPYGKAGDFPVLNRQKSYFC